MRRCLVGAVGLFGLGLLGVMQASARPPAGSPETCAPSFDLITLPELLAQAERNGIPQEREQATFHRVNKNGDEWICQKQLSGENHYNFIDNQSIGRDQ